MAKNTNNGTYTNKAPQIQLNSIEDSNSQSHIKKVKPRKTSSVSEVVNKGSCVPLGVG